MNTETNSTIIHPPILNPDFTSQSCTFGIGPNFSITLTSEFDVHTNKVHFLLEVRKLGGGPSEPLVFGSDWHDFNPQVTVAPCQQPDHSSDNDSHTTLNKFDLDEIINAFGQSVTDEAMLWLNQLVSIHGCGGLRTIGNIFKLLKESHPHKRLSKKDVQFAFNVISNSSQPSEHDRQIKRLSLVESFKDSSRSLGKAALLCGEDLMFSLADIAEILEHMTRDESDNEEAE